MRFVIGIIPALLLLTILWLTSLIARTMAVASVMTAAAAVNIVLWTGSDWLFRYIMSILEPADNTNHTKEIQ